MRRFLRLPQVIEATGHSRPVIYRGIKEGWFPRQYSLGPRSVAWLEEEVQAYINSRVAAGPRIAARQVAK